MELRAGAKWDILDLKLSVVITSPMAAPSQFETQELANGEVEQ